MIVFKTFVVFITSQFVTLDGLEVICIYVYVYIYIYMYVYIFTVHYHELGNRRAGSSRISAKGTFSQSAWPRCKSSNKASKKK